MHRLSSVVRALSSVLLAQGCAAHDSASNAPQRDPAEIVARMMAREAGPFSLHEVALLDGLVHGKIEARIAPKAECEVEKDGNRTCTFALDLGRDGEGNEQSIDCLATTNFLPFGPVIKLGLEESQLTESPALRTWRAGEGIATSFTANTRRETETDIFLGTAKIATLYAHGYMVACTDAMAGGRKTFERIVPAFFDSLTFAQNPKNPTVFAYGYLSRKGERITGMRYGYVSQRQGAEPGLLESSTSFSLRDDGKSWHIVDTGVSLDRQVDGTLETYRSLTWADGVGPLIMSAKPSEGGRFRVKSEVGQRSDAIELTPKAPLATELWVAPELLRLSQGAIEKLRYAAPSLHDGDPTFNYIELTRLREGVLAEREVTHDKLDKPNTTDAPPDELHLDDKGMVVKEVTADEVDELIYTWGELPDALQKAQRRGGRNAR